MEPSVNYLNLEYFLVRTYDFFASFQVGFAAVLGWIVGTATTVMVLGMGLSLVLLVLIVYAYIKLLEVEHGGFHAKEHREHEVHEAEVESTHGNERWEHIVALAASANQGDWRRAILEADIMLGDVLAQQGYSGAGVGEQLKMANPIQMTTLDLAWKAHKVRNEVAHGGESYALSERDARMAIDYYKRVFEEFGAI